MKTIGLFGMAYLYQNGDPGFALQMVELGLSRGSIIVSGMRHKAILANRYEYFLCDYDDEAKFCKMYGITPTYTVNDFVDKLNILKTQKDEENAF